MGVTMSIFSSNDFWKVPPGLRAAIPDRLHHSDVLNTVSHGSESFSEERHHKVNIVDLPSFSLSVTIGQLSPGQATRLHRHNYETIIFILKGIGKTMIEDRVIEWKAGDAIYVPVWALHSHQANATGEVQYLACENAPLLQNLGGIALRQEER